ncbi:MAG: hydrogenase maturation protease [Deltaproteobacteria bacterium]|nr:hydrogenase maturation protease [Deltaproteobacteria bacterium]MBN2673515.1 hydrogenase maturation protease [Deltaproteobacteria bacterium]
MKRIKVLCIGNSLVADDAFGPQIYEYFSGRSYPEHVTFHLLGVGGLDLLGHFEGEDLVVVVDAMNTGKSPGTVRVIPWQQIEKVDGAPVTSHDIGLDEVMKVGRKLQPELMPEEVFFVGVEGKNFTGVGQALSKEVKAAFPIAVAEIERLLNGERPVSP